MLESPPELTLLANSTLRNIGDGIEVIEAPQPPILGEQESGLPQNWGTEGGFQKSREFAKYFASGIRIGGLKPSGHTRKGGVQNCCKRFTVFANWRNSPSVMSTGL